MAQAKGAPQLFASRARQAKTRERKRAIRSDSACLRCGAANGRSPLLVCQGGKQPEETCPFRTLHPFSQDSGLSAILLSEYVLSQSHRVVIRQGSPLPSGEILCGEDGCQEACSASCCLHSSPVALTPPRHLKAPGKPRLRERPARKPPASRSCLLPQPTPPRPGTRSCSSQPFLCPRVVPSLPSMRGPKTYRG